jgi:hypothetical protein
VSDALTDVLNKLRYPLCCWWLDTAKRKSFFVHNVSIIEEQHAEVMGGLEGREVTGADCSLSILSYNLINTLFRST